MDEDLDYGPSFRKRITKLGVSDLIKSVDFIAGVVTFFIIYIYTGGSISESVASQLLTTFSAVSATLFAIVLTGLTIIVSFTDELFLYVWHRELEEFENIATTFQYNLILPLLVLLLSLVLLIAYQSVVMVALIALFVYMLFSLLDLVSLIIEYALQRAEFVSQKIEEERSSETSSDELSKLTNEELRLIRNMLTELKEREEESQDE